MPPFEQVCEARPWSLLRCPVPRTGPCPQEALRQDWVPEFALWIQGYFTSSSYSHSSLLCTFNWSEPTSPTVCMACPSSPQTLCVACPSVGPTALRLLCFPTVRTRPACLACPPRPQGSFHERTKDCSLGSRGRPLPLTTERGQRAVSEASRPFQ